MRADIGQEDLGIVREEADLCILEIRHGVIRRIDCTALIKQIYKW